MARSAPELPHDCPRVTHDGRSYPLLLEASGWRMRSRSKVHRVDFRTGTTNLTEAKRRAREWLGRHASTGPRRGGGTLEALATIYIATPKRTKANVATSNVSRLRTICRVALGKELSAVTCREVGPGLWAAYQRAMLARAGKSFDLVTRYRENIPINAAVRIARTLFLPALLRAYHAAGLEVRSGAGECVMLPEPYVPPVAVQTDALYRDWPALADRALWLAVGLALFAGLRREEIACARAGWIEEKDGVVYVALRDRPEEQWWTKTGRPYRAQVIEPLLTEWLLAFKASKPPDQLLIPEQDNVKWMERVPQAWLREHGIAAAKPLHRLRGLYADAVAKLTEDAVAARLAGIRAAQGALGHASAATTQDHYLSGDGALVKRKLGV